MKDNNYSIITYAKLKELVKNHKLKEGDVFRLQLTPANFKDILDNHNHLNRELNLKKAQNYAKQMKAGLWNVEGHLEGRIFYFDSRFEGLSVQHRGQGSIIAGFTFSSAIIAIVCKDSFLKYSHDKRNRVDQNLMEFKNFDPKTDALIAFAILYLSNRTSGLQEAKAKLYFKSSNVTSPEQKKNLYNKHVKILSNLRKKGEGGNYSDKMFCAVAVFIYCEMLNEEQALEVLKKYDAWGLNKTTSVSNITLLIMHNYLGIKHKDNPPIGGAVPANKFIHLTAG